MQDDEDELSSDVPPPAIPDSLLDSWMLNHFPGRFLDEMDTQMNVFRFLRALQARSIETVESLRKRFREGKIKAEDITADQWQEIQRHDKLMTYLTGG